MLLNSQLALIEHLLGAKPGAKSALSLYHLISPSQRPLDGGWAMDPKTHHESAKAQLESLLTYKAYALNCSANKILNPT